MKKSKLYLLTLFVTLTIFIVSCQEVKPLETLKNISKMKNKDDIKTSLIDIKESLMKNFFIESDYFFPIALIYSKYLENDDTIDYFIEKSLISDNIFKNESVNFYINYLIQKKDFQKLRNVINLYQNFIDVVNKDFFMSYLNNKSIDEIVSFPKKIEYFPLICEIIGKNDLSFKNIKNQEKFENFFINMKFDKNYYKNYQIEFNKILISSNGNPFLKAIYFYITNDKVSFDNNLYKAILYVTNPGKIELLKTMAVNMSSAKKYFESISMTLSNKSNWNKFYYGLELYNRSRIKGLNYLSSILPLFKDLDNYNYAIRWRLIYSHQAMTKYWFNEVIYFVNDYPNTYYAKDLLGILCRNVLFNHKELLLSPYLDKINLDKMEILDQSIYYYLFYLIDAKSEKWKNIILEKYPISYSALKITGGKINISNNNPPDSPKLDPEVNKNAMTMIRKIELLTDFNLIDNDPADFDIVRYANVTITFNNFNYNEKYLIYGKLYDYYLSKDDFYNSTKWAGSFASLLYTEYFTGIDKITLKKIFPLHYNEYIDKYSKEFNIEPALSFAVMREESRFKSEILSGAGAVGLMQIMPSTGKFIADRLKLQTYSLTNPDNNIRMGIYYLAHLNIDDYSLRGAAYNAGPGRVNQWLKTYGKFPPELMYELIPNDESRHYIRKIMRSYYIYKYLLENPDS